MVSDSCRQLSAEPDRCSGLGDIARESYAELGDDRHQYPDLVRRYPGVELLEQPEPECSGHGDGYLHAGKVLD
jgi:hypothetical protein